jgi:UDP-glucose 4-epimerase
VREVLAMVESVAGKPLNIREEPRRAGDPAYLVARADRVRAELGWRPRYDDLQAIVSSSVAWEHKLLKEPWV